MNNLLTKHYQVTETLLKTLKAYIECKNYGIHGYFIKTANKVLNDLMLELYYLGVVQNYLDNKTYKIRGQMREVPIDLEFRTLPIESVLNLGEDAMRAYEEYAKFPQSCLVKEIKYVLEELNK